MMTWTSECVFAYGSVLIGIVTFITCDLNTITVILFVLLCFLFHWDEGGDDDRNSTQVRPAGERAPFNTTRMSELAQRNTDLPRSTS